MAVLSRRTGDEQQESRQAAEVVVVWGGVRWCDFLLCRSLTLTMEPQPLTLMALSDSVSCSLSLPLYLFLFRSLFLSFLFSSTPPLLSLSPSLTLSLCFCLVSLARWLWQPKCTTTSLLQLTPLLPHVCSFPDKRV